MSFDLRLTAGLCLILSGFPALAVDAQNIDCANAFTTVEMSYCAGEELERADAELNRLYEKALAAIPGLASDKPFDPKSWEDALRASQRSWMAFRDAECDQHVPMFWGGGTGTSSAVLGCKTEKTRSRIKELKALYDAE